jgi:hypothetical protein
MSEDNDAILENLFEKYMEMGHSADEAERLAREEFEALGDMGPNLMNKGGVVKKNDGGAIKKKAKSAKPSNFKGHF